MGIFFQLCRKSGPAFIACHSETVRPKLPLMKTGKVVIPLVLLLLWVPFVLQTDLYPLFRFGMFAEPVRREVQTEVFVLRIQTQTGNLWMVAPEETGLGSLAYLMRNYYYRQEADTLLRRMSQLTPGMTDVRQWQLLRVVSPVAVYRPDTVVVATYNVPAHD